MKIDLDDLPQAKDVFDHLRGGRHIDERDYKLFRTLNEHFEKYRSLFDSLGFQLLRHERGFYYFHGDGQSHDLGKRARRISVFFFVFVDALSTKGEGVKDTLFREEGHRIDHLPHFDRVQHKECLAEVGIHDTEDLRSLIKSMDRYNFVERRGDDEFQLRTPSWRFLELCYRFADIDTDEED